MGMQVRIRKGAQYIDDPNDARLKKEDENVQSNQKYKQPIPEDPSSDGFGLVSGCAYAINAGTISTHTAAKLIVSKLRNIYFNTCNKHDDRFDIESFMYMNKILFDTLMDIIESIIKYGKNGITKQITKEFIKSNVEMVEYEVDLDSMYDIIDNVYKQFT